MLEMDHAPKPEQLLFWRSALALGFPIVSITDSGGKSLHILVRINANSERTYRDRVKGLTKAIAVFLPDNSSTNRSRFTRLPGIQRGSGDAQRFQELIYLNPAAPVWEPGCEFTETLKEFSKTARNVPQNILRQIVARNNRNLLLLQQTLAKFLARKPC